MKQIQKYIRPGDYCLSVCSAAYLAQSFSNSIQIVARQKCKLSIAYICQCLYFFVCRVLTSKTILWLLAVTCTKQSAHFYTSSREVS